MLLLPQVRLCLRLQCHRPFIASSFDVSCARTATCQSKVNAGDVWPNGQALFVEGPEEVRQHCGWHYAEGNNYNKVVRKY